MQCFQSGYQVLTQVGGFGRGGGGRVCRQPGCEKPYKDIHAPIAGQHAKANSTFLKQRNAGLSHAPFRTTHVC